MAPPSGGGGAWQELLFLYGFVVDDNPHDHLMVHVPPAMLQDDPCADARAQLLQAQGLSLRWLLRTSPPPAAPTALTSEAEPGGEARDDGPDRGGGLPEETLAALRVVSMSEEDVHSAVALLHQRMAPDSEDEPSADDVRRAVLETCGNAGALRLLARLLRLRKEEMEEADFGSEPEVAGQQWGGDIEAPTSAPYQRWVSVWIMD
eukprot:jgi/Mesen1/412/ME000100S10645